MRLPYILILNFLVLCIFTNDASLIFHSPEKLNGETLRSEQFMFVGDTHKFNITNTRLVSSHPIDLCSRAKNEIRFQDNVVVVTRDNCSPVTKFKNAEKGGAVAIVIMDDPNQWYDLAGSYFWHAGGIKIPGVSVIAPNYEVFDSILDCTKNENITVNVTIVSDSVYIDEPTFIAFSAVIGIWSLINVILGCWKLYHFVKVTRRFRLELPEICLLIEVLASLERLLLCPEPDTGLGRGLYEFTAINGFQTLSITWSTIATMIMASYWASALNNWMPQNTRQCQFKYWKVPFIIVSAFIFLFDLATSITRSLYVGGAWLRMTNTIICGVIVFTIAILFVISGIKVLLFAKQSQGWSASRSKAVQRLACFVIANAGALFATVIGILLTGLSDSPASYGAGFFLAFAAISLVSSLQIMVFQPPDPNMSSSQNSVKLSKLATDDALTIGVSHEVSL